MTTPPALTEELRNALIEASRVLHPQERRSLGITLARSDALARAETEAEEAELFDKKQRLQAARVVLEENNLEGEFADALTLIRVASPPKEGK